MPGALPRPLQGAVRVGNNGLCATAVASAWLFEHGNKSKLEDG